MRWRGRLPTSTSSSPLREARSPVATIPRPALLAQLVEHLHGKEGVDGSSPSEGSFLKTKPLQIAAFLLPQLTL